jgi:PAS domain S-box-containing protein
MTSPLPIDPSDRAKTSNDPAEGPRGSDRASEIESDREGGKPLDFELEYSRAMLAGIVGSAMDAIITLNEKQEIVLFNSAAERMFGCPASEAVGTCIGRFIPERFRNLHRHYVAQFGKTGETSRAMGALGLLCALRKNGEEFPIEAAISHVEVGGEQLFTVIMRDVSEQRRADEALRASESFLRKVIEATPSMIFAKDWDGRFILANEVLARCYGTTIEGVIGKTDADFNQNAEEVARFLHDDREVMSTRQGKLIPEEPVTHADGHVRWFTTMKVPLVNDDGTCDKMLGVATDITARRQAEEALREADRRKDEFLAVLSHELRNPLMPIRSSLYVLEKGSYNAEMVKQGQAIIGRQVAHMSRLVDDLLDVTRIARGKIQLQRDWIELGDIVRRTVEDHMATFDSAGVRFESHIAAGPMWLIGDATRVAQIVGNLLGNAAKFTPRGGQVDLELEIDGSMALLRVRDNGVGIEHTVLDRLFEPFSQAHQTLERSRGGLGLGLALVKGLVGLHGGWVTAASEGPGRGAQFEVRFPLSFAPEPSASKPQECVTERRRVLVIEDSVDAADSLKTALELMGHEARVAYNGRAGIAEARRFHPEVIFCDIGLPEMDGYEVARELRADPEMSGALLVALTGYALPEDMKRAIESGFVHHIAKPPRIEDIQRLLAME